jgi:hypothetical protein
MCRVDSIPVPGGGKSTAEVNFAPGFSGIWYFGFDEFSMLMSRFMISNIQ